jgi:hypothetical protein
MREGVVLREAAAGGATSVTSWPSAAIAVRSTEMPTHVPLPSSIVGGVLVRKIRAAIERYV